jgi:glycosyltransferase involved in cell wall biosynthesis
VRAEIIVAADYSVQSHAVRFPNVKWIYVPDRSISLKRNEAVRKSSGSIIAFIDDDCRPESKWVVEGEKFLRENPQIAGVEGLTRIDAPEKAGAAISQYKRLEKRGYRTNNIFYRRDAFEKAGMFDERFTVQREDLDLSFTIMEQGDEIAYNERQVVNHAYREGEKWDLLKNCVNRRFDPLLHKKHCDFYRAFVRSPFPPGILVLLLMYCATIAAAVFAPKAVFSIAGADMIFVLILTFRRVGRAKIEFAEWVREIAAYAVSPLIMLGAVIYGSVKFRTVLII